MSFTFSVRYFVAIGGLVDTFASKLQCYSQEPQGLSSDLQVAQIIIGYFQSDINALSPRSAIERDVIASVLDSLIEGLEDLQDRLSNGSDDSNLRPLLLRTRFHLGCLNLLYKGLKQTPRRSWEETIQLIQQGQREMEAVPPADPEKSYPVNVSSRDFVIKEWIRTVQQHEAQVQHAAAMAQTAGLPTEPPKAASSSSTRSQTQNNQGAQNPSPPPTTPLANTPRERDTLRGFLEWDQRYRQTQRRSKISAALWLHEGCGGGEIFWYFAPGIAFILMIINFGFAWHYQVLDISTGHWHWDPTAEDFYPPRVGPDLCTPASGANLCIPRSWFGPFNVATHVVAVTTNLVYFLSLLKLSGAFHGWVLTLLWPLSFITSALLWANVVGAGKIVELYSEVADKHSYYGDPGPDMVVLHMDPDLSNQVVFVWVCISDTTTAIFLLAFAVEMFFINPRPSQWKQR